MSKVYWRCDNCGHTFHDEDSGRKEIYREGIYAEYEKCCPDCGSEWIEEGKQCIYCGNWYAPDEEGFDECCIPCRDDAVNALKAYLDEGKEMNRYQKIVMSDYWDCL